MVNISHATEYVKRESGQKINARIQEGIWAGGLQWGEKRDWMRLKIECWVKKASHQRFYLFIVRKAEKMKHSVIQEYIHNHYNYKAKHIQKGSSWGEARVENGFRNRHSGASKALVLFYFLSWIVDTHVSNLLFFLNGTLSSDIFFCMI